MCCLLEKGLDVANNLRDPLLFIQDAGSDLIGRKMGDVFLGVGVFPV
jgi:hypothetical protein